MKPSSGNGESASKSSPESDSGGHRLLFDTHSHNQTTSNSNTVTNNNNSTNEQDELDITLSALRDYDHDFSKVESESGVKK